MSERLSVGNHEGVGEASAARAESREVSVALRFAVCINRTETSGPLVADLERGTCPDVFLVLSPTSSMVNRAKLRAILDWLNPRTRKITIIDGTWVHRWDLIVFDGLQPIEAERRALREMHRLHRRILDVAAELNIAERIDLLRWPEAHAMPLLAKTRIELHAATDRSETLSQALWSVVAAYLAGVREKDITSLNDANRRQLLNYVVEEIAAFIYLTLYVTPLEVYAGDDLPVMRRIAAGEFSNDLPLDLSRRSHLSLDVIALAKGSLRESSPADWPEIERLLRCWPTHFVEAAIPLAKQDFNYHRTLVCQAENEKLLGFMVWSTDGTEIELLWSAVEPTEAGKGIGSAIVRAVLAERRQERRVFGRTATTDSRIPGTGFDGGAYAATHRFFERLGFRLTTRHDRYWGPDNHMVVIEKLYDR